jgi:hypothetical protein
LRRDGADRAFDYEIVMHMQDHLHVAAFGPCDCRHQDITRRALNYVFGEDAVPTAHFFPLPTCVVLEHHVGRVALELRGHQMRVGIGDRTSAGEDEI